MENNLPAGSGRLLALDVLRGMTVAGMILVNNPGSWGAVYAPLRHASWNGLTPTDLVFPLFMFIMGVSTYLSLRKYDFACSGAAVRNILVRTAVIFAVGLAVGWFSRFCFSMQSLAEQGVPLRLEVGEGLDHVWVSFPIKEARAAVEKIALIITE